MQRDLDLVRHILLRLETGEGFGGLANEDDDLSSVHYHVQLMNDAGLVRADELVPGQWFAERMTWEGHEFLDAARNEEIWTEAKRRVERELGSAPFEVVRELLLEMARERLTERGSRRTKKK